MAQARHFWSDDAAAAGTEFALNAAIVATGFLAWAALNDIPLGAIIDELVAVVEALFLL